MNIFSQPWLELSILIPAIGALALARIRDADRALNHCAALSGASFFCALWACLGFYLGHPPETRLHAQETSLLGSRFPAIDELSAPLIPAAALSHFLTAFATARTKSRRFPFTWLLLSQSLRLATFACEEPRLLIALLAAGTVPPYLELLNRGARTRVYLLHMALFVGLATLGQSLIKPDAAPEEQALPAIISLLAAVLVRSGVAPVHCWMTDLFENASFGAALLFVTPLTGVYAAFRLILPIAPDWVLQSIGILSLATAVYAAGMAIVQRDVRRFFAYLLLSQASIVLVGLELHTEISLTGALSLWISVMFSLTGFGLAIRALEARFQHLSLDKFHGLYEHSSTLAVCFLLTGLAGVGFPGTIGFVATELLIDGAVGINPFVGLAVILAGAFNGIAVIRAYFMLFTGTKRHTSVSLRITPRERFAVMTLGLLILIGGLFPQPGIASRHRAAESVLKARETSGSAGSPRASTRPIPVSVSAR